MVHDEAKIMDGLNRLFEKTRARTDKLTEEELRSIFKETVILGTLGYKDIGRDIRLEKTLRTSGRRTDIQCSDDLGRITFVVEFKKPSDPTELKSHLSQLWEGYVLPLRARYGILINGLHIVVYERIGRNHHTILDRDLHDINEDDCSKLLKKLRKPKHNLTSTHEVQEYLKQISDPDEKMTLSNELSREMFLEDFRLGEPSPFSDLLKGCIDLFDMQYGDSRFLTSAFDFWMKSYAKKPYRIPDNWGRILKSFGLTRKESDLQKFMFCLETTYALFTRLILAKACEDYEFPHIKFDDFLSGMREHSFRGDIPLAAWGILATEWIEALRDSLVESVFEEDIFYWWTDKFMQMKDWPTKDLFSDRIEVGLLPFCKALSKLLFVMYRYDFSKIAGDPLGDLYQNYFDKETRKALGEFYTPPEVVNYILDEVGYDGQFILSKRLLDPACGSGTFVVEALRRYLHAMEQRAKDRGWGEVLKNLCNEYHIVGFDIHPFATIMAQIHFMLVLIPYYKKAVQEEKDFVLRRIPIFRTDSLMDERRDMKPDITTFYENPDNIQLRITLPVRKEVGGGEFVEIEVGMPNPSAVWRKTSLSSIPDYFCALQALFDAVKSRAREEQYSINKDELATRLKEYLEDKEWSDIVTLFEPYGNTLLATIRTLKYQFGDGRLVKSVEDVMLAGLLKNYVELENGYDFVVGNPPWGGILKGKKGTLQDDRTKELYSEYYMSARGKYDIYVLFIERSIRWLRDGGKLGFIVQNRFLKVAYGFELRRLIQDRTAMKTIVDFGDSKVFRDATNYPCILVLEKSGRRGSKLRYFELTRLAENLGLQDILDRIANHEEGDNSSASYYSIYSVEQDELSPLSWVPKSDVGEEVFSLISAHDTLAQYTEEIMQGVTIGGEGGENIFCIDKRAMNEFGIEQDTLKRVLKGRDIDRWHIEWSGRYLVYPYSDSGQVLNMDEHPRLKGYLEPHKRLLESRILDGKNIADWNKPWYSLWRQRSPRILNSPKIVVPRIALTNSFALDSGGDFFIMDSAIAIIPKKNISVLFLLGILNSELINYFISKTSPFVQNRYFSFTRTYIERIPIKNPDSPRDKKLAQGIEDATSLIIETKEIEHRTLNFPKGYLADCPGIELEELCFTPGHDVKLLELISTKNLSEGVAINDQSGELNITVENQKQAEYVVTCLRNRRFKKGEKVRLLMPRSQDEIDIIMRKYKEDLKEMEKRDIENLELKINELVFEFYGVDEKLRAFIRSRLAE
ncbi:MAG: N-6 DNA methylase [Candidatus Thermoplasmatota archaeon]|nr:N-6 DNA methylase [Candidatus Thermoplasmatota archaeon]